MHYGFDIGGTKIEVAIFDAQLNQLWSKRVDTPKDNYEHLLTTLVQLIEEADGQSQTPGTIGLGIPGLLDKESGTVYTTNIPCAKNRLLQHDLEQAIGRAVKLENDANCFALSEYWNDEYRHYPSMLGVILGTGLGGGVIVNGKLFTGLNTITGEIGHLRLTTDELNILGFDIPLYQCGCGQYGCAENYLSGRGFEWLYHHFYQQSLPAKTIIQNYYAADKTAEEHVERYLSLLAAYLGSLLTLFDPHLVVIGGGLSNFDIIYQQLPKRLPNHLFSTAKLPRIEKARYGDSGGVRGAALLPIIS